MQICRADVFSGVYFVEKKKKNKQSGRFNQVSVSGSLLHTPTHERDNHEQKSKAEQKRFQCVCHCFCCRSRLHEKPELFFHRCSVAFPLFAQQQTTIPKLLWEVHIVRILVHIVQPSMITIELCRFAFMCTYISTVRRWSTAFCHI